MKDSIYSLEKLFELYFNDQIPFELFQNISVPDSYKKIIVKDKEIYVPNQELKAIQSFIAKFIFKELPIEEDVVFSYRQNKNIKDCLIPHIHNNFFYKTDIVNFFNSIPYPLIKDSILENISFIPYLNPRDLNSYIDRILELVTVNEKLPIGFPTSPFISNVAMRSFDIKLKKYCKLNDFIYTRYSDDIIISSPVNINKDEITSELEHIFYSNFSLNKMKTKIFTRKNSINILGLNITPDRRIVVDKSIKNDIDVGLFFLKNDQRKLENYFNTNVKSAMCILSGKISYAIHIEPDYLYKLVKKHGVSLIQNLIRMKK